MSLQQAPKKNDKKAAAPAAAGPATKESLTAAIKEKADKVTALKKAKEPKDVFMPFVLEMLALKKECAASAPPRPFPPRPRAARAGCRTATRADGVDPRRCAPSSAPCASGGARSLRRSDGSASWQLADGVWRAVRCGWPNAATRRGTDSRR